MEKVLRPAYPAELWSRQKVASLLNALCGKEDKLICVKGKPGKTKDTFKLSEAERRRLKAQQNILAYLSINAELAVTSNDIMEKVLIPAYPDEQWSEMKTEDLLNALCGKEGKITRVKGERGNNAFTITETERRRQEEKRAKKKAALESEQTTLQTELANLKGLFTGRRRREIEARLKKIEEELRGYVYE